MTTAVVLGASGMLGSMVVDILAADNDLEVAGTVRSRRLVDASRERLPDVEWREFDADSQDSDLSNALHGADWIVNAIGLTKPYVHDNDPDEVERAIRVNARFPFTLAKTSEAVGAHVIQIATDCTFSGATGAYTESSPHDALDVYGKTKSLGEAARPTMHLLRCSIIGPEPASNKFLLEWLRTQPRDATVTGFVDHLWNGVTTQAFGRICLGVIKGSPAPGLQHMVPADDVTKADLLVTLADAYGRDDIQVVRANAPYAVDRTLRTEHQDVNTALWRAAGYSGQPSIAEMVGEMARFTPRLSALAL